MAKIIPLRDPTNYRRVLQRIKELWKEGEVEIKPHAKDRMRERDIYTTDMENVIRYGRVMQHSRPKTLWRYVVEGPSVDSGPIGCVVEIDGRLIIVTVVDIRRRRPRR